jgi:hypothetical protein
LGSQLRTHGARPVRSLTPLHRLPAPPAAARRADGRLFCASPADVPHSSDDLNPVDPGGPPIPLGSVTLQLDAGGCDPKLTKVGAGLGGRGCSGVGLEPLPLAGSRRRR